MDTLHYGTMAIIFRDQRSASTNFVRPHSLTVFVQFCQNITSEPKMQKHERKKKRLRWSLEIRPRYSISHHVVAISPRWLNTNLRPKNCNPTAVATLLFSSAKFCPTKSHMPVFYYLTPLIVSCEETPPPSYILAYYRTNKKTPHLTTNGCTALYSLE